MKLTSGQVLAIGLNPIGYLLQGSRTGSQILNVVAPHHALILRAGNLSHRQQVEAAQAGARAQYVAQGSQAQSAEVPPSPSALTQVPNRSPFYMAGAILVAGALLIAAAYSRRGRR